jgi:transcriptional regulator with XRE-family HTH domain
MASVEPFGDKLRHLRRALGLTQLELAVSAGVSERTVRNAERSRTLQCEHLDYLAGALGVDIRELASEPAAVASLISWRRNLEAVTNAIQSLITESDGRPLLELVHPQATLKLTFDPRLPFVGMAQDFEDEFLGYCGMQRFIDLIQEFNGRTDGRKISFHPPFGDGDRLWMRGFEMGNHTGHRLGWFVHTYEFDDHRVLRVDEYCGLVSSDGSDRPGYPEISSDVSEL